MADIVKKHGKIDVRCRNTPRNNLAYTTGSRDFCRLYRELCSARLPDRTSQEVECRQHRRHLFVCSECRSAPDCMFFSGHFLNACHELTCQETGRKGNMIFIGSMSGNIVNIPQPQAPYNASKAAVKHLGASMAVEWAKFGIRVNTISPGYMLTA